MISTDMLAKTKAMIDGMKSVCADVGLANDSSEYKIITEVFLYKFLNDKFLHDVASIREVPKGQSTDAYYAALTSEEREDLELELPDTAIIRPEYLISALFNHKEEEGIARQLDAAMLGIAADNVDVFSVRTGSGAAIKLFGSISRFIIEENKRDAFAAALLGAIVGFSFEETFDEKYDFFADVFEYLISDYNKDSGTYGEYFTPHSIATIIARVLVPEGAKNVTVYDPAAGTGTLVLAAAHQIGEENCTIYTQDRSQKANEFMRLNLILNNLVHSLPNVVHDDTLMNPRHILPTGQLRQFDYIVSNPPFKCDFSSTRDALAGEKYKARFWAGVPNVPATKPEKMAIYLMFLQHIVSVLKEGGKAAVVVPTGFLTAKAKIEIGIRKRLIDEGMLRGVVSMPSNIFANTGTNVSVVFIDSSKKYDHALLMDASSLGEKKKVDGKNQRTFLSNEEIERIIATFNACEEREDFNVLASYKDIAEKNYSFSAGQYFEIKLDYVDITPAEFDEKLAAHMANLEKMFAEGDELQKSILSQLKGLRYE